MQDNILCQNSFPGRDTRDFVVKNTSIPLFPNTPCSNDENFHKEGIIETPLSFAYHCI